MPCFPSLNSLLSSGVRLVIAFCLLPVLAVAAPTTLPLEPEPIAPQKTACDLEQAIRYVDEVEKMIDGSSRFASVRKQARDVVVGLRARVAVAKGDIGSARKLITQIRGTFEKRKTGVSICREISSVDLDVALRISPYLVGLQDRLEVLDQIAARAREDRDLNRYRKTVSMLPPLGPSRTYHVYELLEAQAQFGDIEGARQTVTTYKLPQGAERIASIEEAFASLSDPAKMRLEVANADDERLKEITGQLFRWQAALQRRLESARLVELADASPRRAGYGLLWAAFEKSLDARQTERAVGIAKTMEDWASREQDKRRRPAAYIAAAEMWQKLARPDDAWRCLDLVNGTTPDARPIEKLTRGRETIVLLLLEQKRDGDAIAVLSQPVDDDDFLAHLDQVSIRRTLVRAGRHDLLWKAARVGDPWRSFLNHARVAETMLRFDAE